MRTRRIETTSLLMLFRPTRWLPRCLWAS